MKSNFIFHHISKYFIHELRPFSYRITCELCEIIRGKYKRVKIQMKKISFFVRKILIIFVTIFKFPQLDHYQFICLV